MRVAVVGAGGTGGFFGGCLARAGVDVSFLARGPHLDAIRARGLRVESASAGDFTVRPANATDDPGEIGEVDLVLVCVKSWDLDAAARSMRPMVGPRSAVVPVLNGIDAAERIGRVVGDGHMLGGLAHVEASLAGPGHVRHATPKLHRLTFGELGGGASQRAGRIQGVLERGGFEVRLDPNVRAALWDKFLFICGVSGVCAATRLTIPEIRDRPEKRRLVVAAMREVEALARAKGVALEAGAVGAQVERLKLFGPGAKSSMARDLEQGRRLEVEALNGTAVRLGRELGVATPTNDWLYACLKPFELGRSAG